MNTPFDIIADLHTPVSAFLRLGPFQPRYLLESVDGGHLGRYSFIGFGPVKRVIVGPDTSNGSPSALAELRAGLGAVPPLGPDPRTGRFSGGLVGVAGFDLVRQLYRLPPAPRLSASPVASYMSTESVLVFDHLTRRIALLHASESEHSALRRELVTLLAGPLHPNGARGDYGAPTASLTRSEFCIGVETVKRHITAGDVYQLVLSIKFSGPSDLEPFQVYRALRLLNPSPYMYYIDLGDRQVVGSSPEAMARLDRGSAELWPIAGTRPRGADHDEDVRLEQELLADPKEAAEHVMLVDLARHDLGRAAVAGSVKVGPYRTIERYSHVMHMVSGVTGRLRPGLDSFDLFAAAFPAGTVVGAPKLAAIELIDSLEPVPRDLYSGSVGYFDREGSMDQAITIRTVVFEGDTYSYQAGAGIVADSQPLREHQEVLSKGAALAAALDLAREGM